MRLVHGTGPLMVKQFKELGLIGGIGLAAGMAALYWVHPDTTGGQILLFIIVFVIVSGLLELIAALFRK